jgi:hypothetical protein
MGLFDRPSSSRPGEGAVKSAEAVTDPLMLDGQDLLLRQQESWLPIGLASERSAQQPKVAFPAGGDPLAIDAKPVQLGRDARSVEAQHPSVGDHPNSGGCVGQLAQSPGQQGIDAPVQPDRDRVAGPGRGRDRDSPRQVHPNPIISDSKGRNA